MICGEHPELVLDGSETCSPDSYKSYTEVPKRYSGLWDQICVDEICNFGMYSLVYLILYPDCPIERIICISLYPNVPITRVINIINSRKGIEVNPPL